MIVQKVQKHSLSGFLFCHNGIKVMQETPIQTQIFLEPIISRPLYIYHSIYIGEIWTATGTTEELDWNQEE